MIRKAVECLGNLAQSGGNFTSDNVIGHISMCFDWINTKASKITIFGTSDSKVNNRKFAAILLLTEYCKKLPALSYNQLVITENYNNLFPSLGDPQLEVRHAIVDFFKAISKLILQRDPNKRK